MFPETEAEVLAVAKTRIADLKNIPAGALIYPDPAAWTVRLYAE